MTTTPRKMNAHKKARAISSGFLGPINTFVLTPRQGLADKRTSFRSVIKHHENDDSTPANDLASIQAHRRMMDYCYLNENLLPNDVDEIALRVSMRSHSDSIAVVLRYFCELTEDDCINDRCDREVSKQNRILGVKNEVTQFLRSRR